MGITTYGFGSGALSTLGFGSYAIVFQISAPTTGIRLRTKPLVVQVQGALACKISDENWLDRFDDAIVEILDLESKLAALECLLHTLEATDPLVVQINSLLDVKISEEDFDDKLAAADVSVSTLEGSLNTLLVNIRDLERQTRIYMAKNRSN